MKLVYFFIRYSRFSEYISGGDPNEDIFLKVFFFFFKYIICGDFFLELLKI